MNTSETEPFESGFYDYEFVLLTRLCDKIKQIQEEYESLDLKNHDNLKDEKINSNIIEILEKCYKDQEEKFLEKFKTD